MTLPRRTFLALTSVSTVMTGTLWLPNCLRGPISACTSVGATSRKSGLDARTASRIEICGAASNVAGPCHVTLTPSFLAIACAPSFMVT